MQESRSTQLSSVHAASVSAAGSLSASVENKLWSLVWNLEALPRDIRLPAVLAYCRNDHPELGDMRPIQEELQRQGYDVALYPRERTIALSGGLGRFSARVSETTLVFRGFGAASRSALDLAAGAESAAIVSPLAAIAQSPAALAMLRCITEHAAVRVMETELRNKEILGSMLAPLRFVAGRLMTTDPNTQRFATKDEIMKVLRPFDARVASRAYKMLLSRGIVRTKFLSAHEIAPRYRADIDLLLQQTQSQ